MASEDYDDTLSALLARLSAASSYAELADVRVQLGQLADHVFVDACLLPVPLPVPSTPHTAKRTEGEGEGEQEPLCPICFDAAFAGFGFRGPEEEQRLEGLCDGDTLQRAVEEARPVQTRCCRQIYHLCCLERLYAVDGGITIEVLAEQRQGVFCPTCREGVVLEVRGREEPGAKVKAKVEAEAEVEAAEVEAEAAEVEEAEVEVEEAEVEAEVEAAEGPPVVVSDLMGAEAGNDARQGQGQRRSARKGWKRRRGRRR